MVFTVSLSEASETTVTADYATEDGNAVAGADYAAAIGTLTFAAGETQQTIAIALLADGKAKGEETFGSRCPIPSVRPSQTPTPQPPSRRARRRASWTQLTPMNCAWQTPN